MQQQVLIKLCDWNACKAQLSAIRREVFIEEQHVPEELEWDEYDETAQHVIALDTDGKAVATGRIKNDGHIGRMAVLKSYRQQGIGTAILLALLNVALKNKLTSVYLHAQISAVAFYEKQGFICNSKEFMDAGIAHKSMIKQL